MVYQVDLNFYNNQLKVEVANSKYFTEAILPLTDDITYSPRTGTLSIKYLLDTTQIIDLDTQSKLYDLKKGLKARLSEKNEMCNRLGIKLDIYQCKQVSFVDKGRQKSLKKRH